MAFLDEVAKTTIKLMVREPFYGHLLVNLLKREATEEAATIGITCPGAQTIQLSVSASYWRNALASEPLRYGAIKHQVLHLVFKHVLNAHKYGNAKLFDIAADLVVNQYLSAEQRTDDAVLLADFSSMGLEAHKDVGYYYRALSALLAQTSSEDGVPSEDQQSLLMRIASGTADDHSGWKDFRDMSDGERSIFDGELNRLIRASAKRSEKTRSSLPLRLQQYLDEIAALLEPEVPWKRILRLFSSSSRRTSVRNTLRRPSKRYGTTPGIRIVRHQRLMVAIDTSGSVDMDELRAFFGEIHRIYKQGAEVIVVECDAAIGRVYPYTGQPPSSVSGRGGTSFEAPIQYANEECLPDAIVYFTDGHAPAPETKSRKPILWVVSAKGTTPESAEYQALPGKKVKMQHTLS